MFSAVAAVRALPRAAAAAGPVRVAARAYASGHGHADVLIGPGAKPGTMPSNLEQATGPEREQYLAALEGKKRFITEPQPPKHFGTKQNPVVIYTHFDDRQVGCQGPCPYSEEPGWAIWWTMKVGEDARCTECGQYFSLRRHPDAHASAGHH